MSSSTTFENSITITFSRHIENGSMGMETIVSDNKTKGGFNNEDFQNAKPKLNEIGSTVEIIDLNKICGVNADGNASVLIAKDFVSSLNIDPIALYQQINSLKYDKLELMRGKVKNLRARYKICFADDAQEPDIANGKGTVVPWSDPRISLLNNVRKQLAVFFGCKAADLHAEGNNYFEKQSGIGFHGDGERTIVLAIRLGKPLRLHYQAFQKSEPIGQRCSIDTLTNGDCYLMSEKATGNDWKQRNPITFRHAAEGFHAKKQKYCKPLEVLKANRVKKKKKNEEKKRKREESKTVSNKKQKEPDIEFVGETSFNDHLKEGALNAIDLTL